MKVGSNSFQTKNIIEFTGRTRRELRCSEAIKRYKTQKKKVYWKVKPRPEIVPILTLAAGMACYLSPSTVRPLTLVPPVISRLHRLLSQRTIIESV